MEYYYIVEGQVRNNIGDILQGMAAARFLPENAKPVDREQLAMMKPVGHAFLLASGWFMHDFKKFPPPDSVRVCYISIHIANSALLQDVTVRNHFKKNAPVGCRDRKTLRLLLGWGIPAYYSGCLTITTQPRTTIQHQQYGSCLLVDNVDHPVPDAIIKKLELLTKQPLIRISHDPLVMDRSFEGYVKEGTMQMEQLLRQYCEASLIITTKIHCALPCLGMGAPVLMIHPNPNDPRLDTVKQFIDVLSYEKLLGLNLLVRPAVRAGKLVAQRKFLTKIVSASVCNQRNIIREPDTFFFYWVKFKSVLISRLYQFAVSVLLKSGLAGNEFKRVFSRGIQ